ncbi:oligosaccharide flippase family protein [Patescibacteria group bacterium]
MGGLRIFTKLILFGKLAVLARVLTPSDFGAFGIASLALALLEVLSETGINTVLIQSKKHISYYLDTAYVVSIIRGILIGAIIVMIAPVISKFFDTEVSGLLYLTCLIPIIRGFINPAVAKLSKDLEFQREFRFRASIYAIDALVATIVSIVTRSPAGFIWGMIAGATIEAIISHLLIKPNPRLRFDRVKFSYILKNGKWVTGFGVLQYLYREGDDVVVGKLLGQTSLGLYQTAYKISTMPVREVADVVTRVTFPVYVKIAVDLPRLKKAFNRTFVLTVLTSSIFGVAIILFAAPIVKILLGEKWLEIVGLVKILAVFGVGRSIVNSFDSLFLATKNQKFITYTSLVGTIVMFVTIFPLIAIYELNGAGYATILSLGFTIPMSIYYMKKVI